MGMAAQLSTALLGKRVEGVWHTGLLVYGKEFFFGGGIQVPPVPPCVQPPRLPRLFDD